MPPQTTRTLNPLPFQDLEPHRFEDLVRQLAYGWRNWTSLEALGRTGQDDGIDIRGVENSGTHEPAVSEARDAATDEDEVVFTESQGERRLWIIQCKREKSMAPGAVKKTIDESLRSLASPPYGFVLAVAADVSKKARDVFRAEMVSRGIQEFHMWARGELEDMLFQAQNDNLLFAYFNLSLQPRRRGLAIALRSTLAVKRQLHRLVQEAEKGQSFVLLRDATDTTYPGDEDAAPGERWRVSEIHDLKHPGCLTVVSRKRLAATADDDHGWDVLDDSDVMASAADGVLRGLHGWGRASSLVDDEDEQDDLPLDFWRAHIEERNQAHLHVLRLIPFDRIVALDTKGDGHFPIPHLFIVPDTSGNLFEPRGGAILVPIRHHMPSRHAIPENRRSIFPQPLPVPGAPLPASFDATMDGAPPLPSAVRDELTTKVIAPDIYTSQPDRSDHDRLAEQRMASFNAWKTSVGLPTLSSWVLELRSQNQRANIVPSSEDYERSAKEPSLILKIEVERKRSDGSSYWLNGSVSVIMTGYGGWRFTASPNASGSYRREEINVPDEGPSAELLNTTILGMINTLTKSA